MSNVDIEGSNARQSTSSRPRELIHRILVSRQLLIFEVAAIRIQAGVRKYLAIRRTANIRYNLKCFLEVTSKCCNLFIEEMILQQGFLISRSIIDSYMKLTQMKSDVFNSILFAFESIESEVLMDIIKTTVDETIVDAINTFLQKRPQQVITSQAEPKKTHINLIISLISDFCNELVDEYIRSIVISAVLEEVKEYRKIIATSFICEDISNEVIAEESILILQSLGDLPS